MPRKSRAKGEPSSRGSRETEPRDASGEPVDSGEPDLGDPAAEGEELLAASEEESPPRDPYDPPRPIPRNLLLRPPPRRLPPIEREAEMKARPDAIDDDDGGPGRRGRRRGRRGGRSDRGRERRDRGGDGRERAGPSGKDARTPGGNAPHSPPPPAASPPTPPSAPAPASGWDGFGPPPPDHPAAREPESPTTPPPPPPRPTGEGGDRDRGHRRDRDRGAGRRGGRDRDRERRGERDRDRGESRAPSPSLPPSPSPAPPPARGPDLRRWLEGPYREAVAQHPERKGSFAASTGAPRPPLAVPGPDLVSGFEERVGWPGEFPFTRGVQPTMYRGRLWTMRQYAGFTSAEETNRRFRYLLGQGQTGLSVAFDLPTQIGYDSDDPRAEGEVGKVGVPVNSLADMETVLDGIPLDRVTVSMTINATAPILVAMVAATAKRRGIPLEEVGGTVQNDLLKEFVARNTWRFPVEASLDLSADLMRFCVESMPRWNPISVSGYHMREAGCTAAQEIAFTLGHGLAYLERAVKAGIPVERIAPRMSFFFAAQMDLLEEVAKFRAARRLWALLVRERFRGDDASCRLRFHTQTAGVALTSAQPEVNVVRVTLQALAAVLGGTQSLHTNSRDEALGLPTEESALLALRTQQVLAEESGVADTVDPLGGAPLVEAETDRLEAEARGILAKVEEQGGPVEAVRKGWTQARIAEAAYRHQRAVESGETVVVGVNRYAEGGGGGGGAAAAFRVAESAREALVAGLKARREARDGKRVDEARFGLELAAGWGASRQGLMPAILRCVEAECTVGEICRSLEKAFGAYDPANP